MSSLEFKTKNKWEIDDVLMPKLTLISKSFLILKEFPLLSTMAVEFLLQQARAKIPVGPVDSTNTKLFIKETLMPTYIIHA